MYQSQLVSNPLRTNMATNFFLCFFGDFICQFLTKKVYKRDKRSLGDDRFDMVRSLRQGTVGCCIQTTLLYFYLKNVAPYVQFSPQVIKNAELLKASNLMLKVTVHMSTLLPLRLATFLFFIGALKHLSVEGGLQNLRHHYFDTAKAGYSFWPFVMIGLYAYIPQRFGSVYYDSFNLLWNVILSYIANRQHTQSQFSEETKSMSYQNTSNLSIEEESKLYCSNNVTEVQLASPSNLSKLKSETSKYDQNEARFNVSNLKLNDVRNSHKL